MSKRLFSIFMLLVCGIVSVSAQAKSPKKYIFDTVKTTAATKTVTAQKPVVTAKSVTTTKTTTVQKPVVTAKSATATKTTAKTTPSVKTAAKATTVTKAKPKAKTTATKAKVTTTTKAKTATTAKTTTTASKSVPKSYETVKKPAAKVTDKVTAKGTGLIPQSSALPISFNNQMLAEINALRKSGTTCGGEKMPPVKALVWNAQLEKAAVVHVADMDANDHFSHAGMDGTMPDDRIKSAGYEWERVGENIGQGYKDVSAAMKGWKESTNHCKQMMSAEVTEMGAAKKGKYWCQTFAKPLE